MKRSLVAALFLVTAFVSPSHAAAQAIVAVPGAQALDMFDAPYTDDATPTDVATSGTQLTFVNLDPVANFDHNAESVAKGPDCSGYPVGKCPLWRTRFVGAGGSATADLTAVPPGLYPFICRAHPGMRGVLQVIAP